MFNKKTKEKFNKIKYILFDISIEIIIGRFRGPNIAIIISPFNWQLDKNYAPLAYFVSCYIGPIRLCIKYGHK